MKTDVDSCCWEVDVQRWRKCRLSSAERCAYITHTYVYLAHTGIIIFAIFYARKNNNNRDNVEGTPSTFNHNPNFLGSRLFHHSPHQCSQKLQQQNYGRNSKHFQSQPELSRFQTISPQSTSQRTSQLPSVCRARLTSSSCVYVAFACVVPTISSSRNAGALNSSTKPMDVDTINQ